MSNTGEQMVILVPKADVACESTTNGDAVEAGRVETSILEFRNLAFVNRTTNILGTEGQAVTVAVGVSWVVGMGLEAGKTVCLDRERSPLVSLPPHWEGLAWRSCSPAICFGLHDGAD
jgi:hypothetical protein